jgi:hypothetical protein
MTTQPKQANITNIWMKICNLLARMHVCHQMCNYGLKPPPNSIIHLLLILDQRTKTTWRIKILIWWCLVFDTIFIALVPKRLPLWHQPPKRKTLKEYRKQIGLSLIKDLSIKTNWRTWQYNSPLNECSPLERTFSPIRDEEILPLTEIFYLGKKYVKIEGKSWFD